MKQRRRHVSTQLYRFLPMDYLQQLVVLKKVAAKFNHTIIKIGETFKFDLKISTTKNQLGKIRIEYAIDYIKKKLKGPKKFFRYQNPK